MKHMMLILIVVGLSGCVDSERAQRNRAELDKLAQCVCTTKGGVSYIRFRRSDLATAVCHKGDTQYDLRLGDICHPPVTSSTGETQGF